MSRKTANLAVLFLLLAIGILLAYLTLRPFLRPIAFAVIIGIGCYPFHAKIKRFLPRRNLHALVSTLAVLLMFVVPAFLLASAVSGDIVRTAQHIKDRADERGGVVSYLTQSEGRLLDWLERRTHIQSAGITEAIESLPARASAQLLSIATSLVTSLAGFVGESLITLLVLFFVFRDGPTICDGIASLLPLKRERTEFLFSRIRESVYANVYGILAVAAAQGLLTSVALLILGVGSPLLLGIAAAVCSMIPLVGPALVWVPVSIFLFLNGPWWKAIFLIAWGLVVVGTADNIIRPWVIAGKVKLHPVLLLFALIGGVQQFGFVGLFIGPIAISLIFALVDMLREEIAEVEVRPEQSPQLPPVASL